MTGRREKFRDRQGREVWLSPERWRHIVSGHPEIEAYEREVRVAVEEPSAVLAGREPDEEWLYLEGAGLAESLAEGGRGVRQRGERAYHHCIRPTKEAISVTIADITFDRVEYDADADVLYLHVGDPSRAVDYDETPEGHAVRFDSSGELVGLTLVRPKRLLERNGELRVTVPVPSDVPAAELTPALSA
jgi:uncharacterized protein YuzE